MSAPWVVIAGWTGASLMLVAYVLVSARRLAGHGAAFQWMNLLGSIGLAANSAINGALPSAVLNVIWMAIGIFALLRHPGRVASDQPAMP